MGSCKCQVCFFFPVKILYLNYVNRPKNKKELFNLCHASACNVIERIFGVLKKWFRILILAPEYSLHVQAGIPAALCALHNFISTYDQDEGQLPDASSDPYDHGTGDNEFEDALDSSEGLLGLDASIEQDKIAEDMWNDYQEICRERGIEDDSDSQSIDSDMLDDC